MQWLQNQNQSNVDNPNNIRCEASRHFRKKKREYLKHKINVLETTARIRISKTFIGASMNLRRVTSLELI
jgi:hypothetical protein